ncbi:MAG: hypothetical protein NC548_35185 [Lachnospiraceae bacterium]|nr:hypothetical protein [Lachnospiraceae bacterium]
MYASLGSSYQWNMMNQNGAVTNRIAEVLKNERAVTPEQLATAFSTIRNRVRSPIMNQLMDAIKKGDIVMVFAETVKIPLYLPFIVLQANGKYTGVVFLDHCECTPGETEYNVDPRKLKVSLESCYFALRMMAMDSAHSTKLVSPDLIRPATKIYTHSLIECINRKYSIKLDQIIYNQVSFMISRFFIGTVLGYNPDSSIMENFCLYDLKNPEIGIIRIVNDQFTPDDMKNVSTFITKLVDVPELKGRIGKLNVSSLVQMYVSLYNAPMTLALEVFPYLVYNILSVIQTTYVNNYHMLKNIIGDDGNKLYGHLVAILPEH